MRSTLLVLLLAGMVAILLGCAPCTDCGSLKRQHDITTLFFNNEIVPGYNYYYNGREQWPSAIMGIDSDYTVVSKFWKSVDLEGEALSQWLRDVTIWKEPRRAALNGAEILDPNGARVGVFFSKYDNLVTKFDGTTIQVYPPSYLAGEGLSATSKDRN